MAWDPVNMNPDSNTVEAVLVLNHYVTKDLVS